MLLDIVFEFTMTPITSEDSRYNEVDHHRNTTPSAINGRPVPSFYDATNEEQLNQQRPVDLNIDPPKGFEPNAKQSGTSSPPGVSSGTCENGRPGSGTPSQGSSLSSCIVEQAPTQATNGIINGQMIGTQSRDISDGSNSSHSPQSEGEDGSAQSSNRTASNHETVSSQEPSSSFHVRCGIANSGTNGSQNKELQPTASTSSYRLVDGLNNIVTKITKVFANTSLSMISTDRCLQTETPKFAFGHKRTLEKTWNLMDKVVKCCQKPRMNLNNSPPFILEILPETYQHLKLIHTKHDAHRNQPVNDNDYSEVFLRNLQNRCKQTLKLFKDAKEEMFDEESDYRHKLTRNTLVFNHILSELKAIFPNGHFIGDKYLITKKESAGEFWKKNFGSSVLVDWKTFYHALQQVHNIDSSFFSLNALKQTIDLTCDDYISIFEFDVFTRLFQPWATLLRNWQILAVTHPGYKAFLTYDELKARLQKYIDKPGSYVFRLSCTRLGQWAIGYVTPDRQILQTIVQNISLSQALTETKFYLYPDGKDEDPSLSVLCSGMDGDERNVTVTEEQYEIYCGVGNSFQTCKICFQNDKDIRVEPCNHLLCTSCLLNWQESEGQGCPYCRTEIKETVQIVMDFGRSKSTEAKQSSRTSPNI